MSYLRIRDLKQAFDILQGVQQEDECIHTETSLY